MTPTAPAPAVVTMGEPAGIGAEISLRAWLALRAAASPFALMHDPDTLGSLARRLGLDVPLQPIDHPGQTAGVFARALPVLPVALPVAVRYGTPDPAQAGVVVDSITRAVRWCQAGEAGALVTNPIQKSTLYQAGFAHPGHTEYLQHLAGEGARAVMMLACEGLRVVPVTIHQSLASAIAALDTDAIVAVAQATARALRRDFGLAQPRLAVAGLNPHAGEDGSMGREDIDRIAPAVARLRAAGLDVRGPLPADSMFTPRARAGYDAAICMYHDQALIPVKALDMDGGVNVTLGLPFVRTSPDHGTALDIAGQGLAHPGSLIQALRMAASIAAHRSRNPDPHP